VIATGNLAFRALLLGLTLTLACDRARAQIQPAQPQPAGPQIGTIHGVVKSGTMPIPGAQVSISLGSSAQKIAVWTDVDGIYSAAVPSYGS